MNLRQMRQKLDLTQADMAERLGVSRPTYVLIEKGQKELTVSQVRTLSELFELNENDSNQKTVTPSFCHQFNAQKFKELLLYILEKVGAKPNIGETALYKLLYFVDFDFYEHHHRSVTGATYMKNHHGPTPKAFKSIADEMIRLGELERVKSRYFKYHQKKYLPCRSADLSFFSAIEMVHVDGVLNRLSDKNGNELSAHSHEDVPWLATDDQHDIDYDLVFQRSQSFAQTNLNAMWQAASGQDIVNELGHMPDVEYDYYQNLPVKR